MDKINKIKEKILERYFEAEEDKIAEREDNIEEYQNHKENVIFLDEVNDSVEDIIVPTIVEKIEPAIISKCTIIEGDIKVENDIEVYGQVIGNVESTGCIYIENAVVMGKIAGNEVLIKNSKIQGDIYSIAKIDLQVGTEIIGDIKSKQIFVNCQCTGNVVAEKIVYLLDQTVLKGDVQTPTIRIDEGAMFEGVIKKSK